MPTGTLPKACVILGAGASHDVRGEGSPEKTPDFRPPLARDLFDMARKPRYWQVIEPYRGARFLAQELAPLISSGQTSIEKKLREYAEHSAIEIRQNFKYIPPYLRDLLYLASTEYTPMPSGYVQVVKALLADHPHEVLFLVLNYDTLLETALSAFSRQFEFRTMAHYIQESRKAKVVKLHGSINWFRQMSRTSPGDSRHIQWDRMVEDLDIFETFHETAIQVMHAGPVVRDYSPDDYLYYPVLTAPLAGKGPSDTVCPKSHVDVAREFLKECSKFLIIGTSALDDDLLDLLDSAIPPNPNPLVHIVDTGNGAGPAATRFERRVRAFPGVFETSNTFRVGFQGYLREKKLQSFARASNLDP